MLFVRKSKLVQTGVNNKGQGITGMKFRIAICDNDENDLERACNLVDSFLRERKNMEGEIIAFSSPQKLLKAVVQEDFDLYLLDILMPEMTGIELGKLIREKSRRVPIIYMTSSREFAFEAYGVQAMYYLEKPVSYKQLEESLYMALKFKGKEKENKILINTRDGVIAIDSNDVLYVENESRTAVYYLNNGEKVVSVSNRRSFEETVEGICKNNSFIHPHKSYYVNMQYIRLIRQTSIYLDNDVEIPISRKHLTEMKKLYLNFVTEESDLE